MKIEVKKDEESGEHYFDVQDFAEYYDISKIDSYKYEILENDDLALTFYDRDGNILKPIK